MSDGDWARIAELERSLEKAGEEISRLKEAQKITGKTSDSYHTFDELYDHRCLLWINLCLKSDLHYDVYWVKDHYEGWDLLVWEKLSLMGTAEQVSYHVPIKYRVLYEDRFPLMNSFEFNGHTSDDVLRRLEAFARSAK